MSFGEDIYPVFGDFLSTVVKNKSEVYLIFHQTKSGVAGYNAQRQNLLTADGNLLLKLVKRMASLRVNQYDIPVFKLNYALKTAYTVLSQR
ncbi:hypothetical protein [Succinatimonas hippei]|uniref:hypothetical protein n=1 Tax=Succinatimonas hippei TaxID=626938 RepID=UPI0026F288F8|nr:hypothetical protein [Succinatimonas hippei]